jgi:hypothetical protein
MGIDGMALAVASGEIVGDSPIYNFTYPDGKVFGCYGCTATPLGLVPWQRTTSAGSRGWFNVSSGAIDITDPAKTDGRWQVTPIPTGGGAFSIYHECYSDHRLGC